MLTGKEYNVNQKFKNLFTTNYAKDKGACKWYQTRTWNGSSWENKFEDAPEFYKLMREFKQVSTGLNHTERETVVIDVDEPIENMQKFLKSLPLQPNAYNYKKIKKSCQFYYFLESPVAKESEEWKKLLAFSRQYGDPKFTGWQMRNPYYSEGECKSVVLHYNKFTPNMFYNHLSSSISICVNVTLPKQTQKGIPINKTNVSRNTETFYALGRWMAEHRNRSEDELFAKWKELNTEICADLDLELSPECEGLATVRSLMNYERNNCLKFSYSKEANAESQRIRKEKAAWYKQKAIELHESGLNVTEIARELDYSRMQIYRFLNINKCNINTYKNKKKEAVNNIEFIKNTVPELNNMKTFIITNNQRKNYTLTNVNPPTNNELSVFEDTFGKGIHYARQSLLEYCREEDIPEFWMLDDDITAFYQNVIHGDNPLKLSGLNFNNVNTQGLDLGMLINSAYLKFRRWDQINKSPHITQCVYVKTASFNGFNYCEHEDFNEDIWMCIWALEKGLKLGKICQYGFKAKPSKGKHSNFLDSTKAEWECNIKNYLENSFKGSDADRKRLLRFYN